MKAEDIKVGHVYTDGKGKMRKVDKITEMIRDVLYTHVHDGPWKGRPGRKWLPYFAQWAKSEVDDYEQR